MSLTDKQAAFVREYLVDLNGTQAAIRAGYSEKTANEQAARLLANASVSAAVKEAMDARARRTEVTADRVLAELAKLGFTDLADVADWGVRDVAFGFDGDGKRLRPEDIGEAASIVHVEAPFLTLKNKEDLTPAARAAVSEVALTKDGFKIKLHDKNAALVTIARHLGMLKDKTEHDIGPTLRELIAASMKPREG